MQTWTRAVGSGTGPMAKGDVFEGCFRVSVAKPWRVLDFLLEYLDRWG